MFGCDDNPRQALGPIEPGGAVLPVETSREPEGPIEPPAPSPPQEPGSAVPPVDVWATGAGEK